MCRFNKRCENFYPDQDNPSNCLLLCQKNPLALAIALMPDRYVERDVRDRTVDKKVISMDKKIPDKATRKETIDDEYEEMVTATQELDNEVVEFEFDPEGDIASKLTAPSDDLSALIKKTEENRNSTVLDKEVSQAIEDNITDHDEVKVHPLDEINFEPVERVAIIDQPKEPDNAEIYIKTRERGRPKMTDKEKAKAQLKRDKEKVIRDEEKREEAIKRRVDMKAKVAKNRAKKKKLKK